MNEIIDSGLDAYELAFETLHDVNKFVKYWLEHSPDKYEFVPPSTWLYQPHEFIDVNMDNNTIVQTDFVVASAKAAYTEAYGAFKNMYSGRKGRPSNARDDIPAAIQRYMSSKQTEKLIDLKSRLIYQGPNDQIEKFLTLVNSGAPPKELDVIAVKQWFWNLKRKIFGKSHRFEQMLVFTGPQGVGKTKILESLASSILKDYTTFKTLEDIMQPRSHINFARYYVTVFDELAGASRTCIATMKDLITKDKFSPHVFYTQNTSPLKMIAMLIGTSNKPVTSIIIDNTGMRRFYEITIPKKMDIQEVLDFDWNLLLSGIDENFEAGYIVAGTEDMMMEKSDADAFEDDFETFINEYGIQPTLEEADTIEVESRKLFTLYYDLAKKNNFLYVKNASVFGRCLKAHGVTHRNTMKNKRIVKLYQLSREALANLDEGTITSITLGKPASKKPEQA